jgi:L-aspartate oxidase
MTAVRYLPASSPTWERHTDVVVVGSGAAGMSTALEAAAGGRSVLLVTKGLLGGGSTPLAQGGLAAVLDPGDSPAAHIRDTLVAGGGLCDEDAVAALVGAAPSEIGRLESLGAHFDAGPLGLEGGHSHHRIVHAGGDASGAEVHRTLVAALRASRVEVLEHAVALDALLDSDGRAVGLLVGRVAEPASLDAGGGYSTDARGPASLDAGGALAVGTIHATAVVVATGGYGQAFATTTNPAGATGDGLALAGRAGAEVADVEFVQFHPTVLWQPGSRGRRPLVTEALRGAGAVVIDVHGRRVMPGVHPLADLAPRDVVAAAMHRRMTTGDGPSSHLWLDATAVGRGHLDDHFPTVTAACRAVGIDPAVDPIPVAPGAHYACGGIRADMDGRTSVEGLYAVGEVAATGVHGANRLASNSLTEAIATGRRLGRLLASLPRRRASGGVPPAAGSAVAPSAGNGLADAMSRHAGVLRHAEGLEHLLDLLDSAPSGTALDLATVEATNLHTVSTLVARAALERTESRGCHRRSDMPATRPEWARRLVWRAVDGTLEPVGVRV